MRSLLSYLIPLGMLLLGVIPILVLVAYYRLLRKRELRESPLTRNLLRPPGHSLKLMVGELDEEIGLLIAYLTLIPLFAYTLRVHELYFVGRKASLSDWIFGTFAALGLLVGFAWQLVTRIKRRRAFVLGLEGEQFVGEELNQLMRDGCRVFHDVPFPYGNIDHVVISESGVFSVNTKMVGKPKTGDGKADVIVDHPRSMIRLPDREFPIPTNQLETEARWLTEYLSKAVGQPISVEPMLALPGWYLKERIGHGSVYVFNPQSPKKFFVHNRTTLTPQLIQQAAHQLEQLCRDVEPSFREKRGWASAK